MAAGGEKRRKLFCSLFTRGYMASTIFVRIAGKVQGPFDAAKIKKLVVTGQIGRDDELSRDGRAWTAAQNVKGLTFASTSIAEPAFSTSTNRRATPTTPAKPRERSGGSQAGSRTLIGAAHRAALSAPSALRQSAGSLEGLPAGLPRRLPAARLSLNLQACPDCGGLVSVRACDCPHCGGPLRELPLPAAAKAKYHLLRWMAAAYAALAIVAVLVAASCAVLLVYFFLQGEAASATVTVLALAGSITAGITCFAISEGIGVFLQIEQNTRATRLAATRRAFAESGA